MKKHCSILLIEDDRSLAEGLMTILASEGFSVTTACRGDEGCQLASKHPFDLVITDLRLPGLGGMEVVRRIHQLAPSIPILLITAHGTTETAIDSMREGAFDYLIKPFEMEEFLSSVHRALTSSILGDSEGTHIEPAQLPASLIGRSRLMQALYKEIGRVASKPVTVLIRGETGTGKELVARALHEHGGRSGKPFIAVNCAALTESLLESELFGHERGAFTGAVERRIGRFEQAAEGTLFLDEIGEMGPTTQAKLLRILQEGTFERVGGRETLHNRARVVAATHVNLEEAISKRSFREDLYYRLDQVTLTIPPLRDRPQDIPLLTNHFANKHARSLGFEPPTFHPGTFTVFQAHAWPGNVRELENSVRQCLLRTNGFTVLPSDASAVLNRTSRISPLSADGWTSIIRETLSAAERGDLTDAHDRIIRQVEGELLTQAMSLGGGNQSRVARWLGLSRVTLREKLRSHGLKASQETEESA